MASRTISVEIVGDASSLQRAFNKVEDSSRGIGQKLVSFGKVAGVGLAAVGVAAGVTGKKMLDLAGNAEETDSKLNVVFGKQLPKLKKDLDKFSDATGASSFKLREQAADLGALLGPLVGTQKGAADMSERFVKLATDLGSFNNVPVDDALLAIRSGLVGEAEPLRRFGVLLNEASVAAEAQRLGLVKGKEALTEQQKVLARASLIQKQTTQAQGDATRTAGSYTNSVKALKNTVTDLATGMGAKLIPAATAVAGGLNDFINKVSAADGAGAKFGVGMDALKGLAATAVDGIRTAFNAIDWQAVGQTLLSGLRAALNFLSNVDYGSIIRTVAGKVFNTLKDAFNAIDFNAVGNQVGNAIVSALGKLTSFISRVNWNQVGQAIVAGMGVAIKALGSWLAGLDYPAILVALTKGLVAVLKGLAGLLIGIATALGKALIKGIGSGIDAAWPAVKAWLAGLPGRIVALFAGAGRLLYNIGASIIQGLWDGLKSRLQGMLDFVSGIGGKIKSLKGPIEKDKKLLEPEGRAIILGLETGMMASWATLAPKINALGQNIIHNFILGIGTATPQFTGKLGEAAQAALDNARSVVERYQTQFGNAFGKLADAAKRIFDAKTASLLDAIDRKFQAKMDKWSRLGEALTPAEKALSDLDKAEAKRSREQALTTAIAGGDPEQIRAAELAITRAALEDQAAVERAALDKRIAANIAKLDQLKEKEAQNLEERRAQLGTKLDEQLVTLQERLAKHPEEYNKINKKINELLGKFGISMKESGKLLGTAFAAGIRESYADVERAAKKLAQIVADYVPHSPAKKGPLSEPPGWAAYLTTGFPAALRGVAGTVGGVGAPRPSALAGVAAGGLGSSVTVNVHGWVGDDAALARHIRDQLVTHIGRDNGSIFGGVA